MPDFPKPVGFVWFWFCELQTTPDVVLSYQELQAWAQLTNRDLTPGEVRALRQLSKDYVNHHRSNG